MTCAPCASTQLSFCIIPFDCFVDIDCTNAGWIVQPHGVRSNDSGEIGLGSWRPNCKEHMSKLSRVGYISSSRGALASRILDTIWNIYHFSLSVCWVMWLQTSLSFSETSLLHQWSWTEAPNMNHLQLQKLNEFFCFEPKSRNCFSQALLSSNTRLGKVEVFPLALTASSRKVTWWVHDLEECCVVSRYRQGVSRHSATQPEHDLNYILSSMKRS